MDAQDERIDIVIPVYNVAKVVEETLATVRAQTWTAWRCFCVNDGSVDGSGSVLDACCRQDSRIRVIHQRNAGVSVARNRGMEIADGTRLFFLDSDDLLPEDSLQQLMAVAARTGADWVSCRIEMRKEDGTHEYRLPARDACLSRNQFLQAADFIDTYVVWGKLFNRNWLARQGLRFERRLEVAEDALLMTQAVCLANRIAHVGSCVGYVYKVFGTGLMARSSSVYPWCRMEALRILMASGIRRRDEVARSFVVDWARGVMTDFSLALRARRFDWSVAARLPIVAVGRTVWPDRWLVVKWLFWTSWVLLARFLNCFRVGTRYYRYIMRMR